MTDRSSNVDYEDCGQCADVNGSGVCSNCENDGRWCSECDGSGKCQPCEGTGRSPIADDPEMVAAVAAAGPLIAPEEVEDDGEAA